MYRFFQSLIKKRMGFCPPLIMGCGFFSSRFGLLPRRQTISTVVGSPIEVPHIKSPSKAQVEVLHHRYCSALSELFEKHKLKHGVPKDVHLQLH
jgi:2-acylglycerol O-acyltransferase 2